MLCAVGDLIEDVVAHLDGPIRTGADAAARISRHRGGSAANVAAAAARLSGRSRYVGAIGDDATGERLVRGLKTLGVDCRVQREGTTGTIVALIDETGERTFVTDRGASSTLRRQDGSVLADVTALHITGYAIAEGETAGAAVELAAAARGRGILISVDPSSTSVGATLGVESYRQAIAALHPDLVLPNQDEAEQLDLVVRPLAPLTVVTAGAAPTIVVHADEQAQSRAVEVPDIAAPMVDSTGAGDAFAAGFLLAWIDGAEAVDAVTAGHHAASRVITGPGGDHWI